MQTSIGRNETGKKTASKKTKCRNIEVNVVHWFNDILMLYQHQHDRDDKRHCGSIETNVVEVLWGREMRISRFYRGLN